MSNNWICFKFFGQIPCKCKSIVEILPVRLASSSPFLRSKQIENVQNVQNGQLDKILVKIIS